MALAPKPTAPAANRIFFPNLNGLRFIAALLVVIDHVEGYRDAMGVFNHWAVPAIPLLGQLGVTLFFVLSGFLITYLLLAEKQQFGRIKLGDFYLRRLLRIWPLYYAVVILSLFVIPHIHWFDYPGLTPYATDHLLSKCLLYGLMLPNVAREAFVSVPYLSQAWSIGVEEQFYIFWPWVIQWGRRYGWLLLGLALAFTVATQLPWFVTSPKRGWVADTPFIIAFKNFMAALRIQSMCIGGLFAVVLFFRMEGLLRVLRAAPTQWTFWIIATVLTVRGQQFGPLTFEVYSVVFGVIILNLAMTETSIFSLSSPVLDYLGRISYGLYMLHGLAIVVGFKAAQALGWEPAGLPHQALMYVVAVAVAIVLAGLSYQFLEKPFLKLKKLFVRVESGARV